jgi:AcrR family transcriptional regulator
MSLDVKGEPEANPLQALPRGRHNLPADVVRASQRERLLRAMLESVAERGYEATTVPSVVAEARVSRNAFYELFSDKTECFLALCDQLAAEILDAVSVTTETEWVAALRSGMARYLRWWEEHPAFSRTYFVELPAAGQRAVAQRDRQYERFRSLFEQIAAWAREQQPDLPPLRPLAIRAVVVAVTELIAEEVRAQRVGRLTELEDELVFLTVMLLADEATARDAIRSGV